MTGLAEVLGLPATAVETVAQIDSTNTAMKRYVHAHRLTGPRVLVADEQTKGYGRYGRQFLAPAGVGLYLTIAWPVDDLRTVDVGALTLGLAVATQRAIKQVFGMTVAIKWVNDLYWQGKKVAGVLTEAEQTPSGPVMIAGIGLNLLPWDMPDELAEKAGALLSAGRSVPRETLISAIYQELQTLRMQKFADFKAEYEAHSLHVGRSVQVKVGLKQLFGEVLGFADSGALILRTPLGIESIATGEITKVEMEGFN